MNNHDYTNVSLPPDHFQTDGRTDTTDRITSPLKRAVTKYIQYALTSRMSLSELLYTVVH